MDLKIDPRITQSVNVAGEPPRPDRAKNLEQLRKSTRELEAMYIFEVYKSMRKTVPDGGLFKKSMSTDVFQEMLDMEMAKTTASGKGLGIGQAMYDQLKDKIK